MTKLEKLRADLAKAETTLGNAKKRKAFLENRIRKEEQRELQAVMDNAGLTFSEVRDMLTTSASAVGNATEGSERP